MSKKFIILLVVTGLVVGLAADSGAAIAKVARRLNVFSIFGGYAHPVGSYGAIYDTPFIDSGNLPVSLDAGDVYDPGYYFGFNYGQLRNNHILFSLGFRWTHINIEDTIWVDPVTFYTFEPLTPNFNQYDLDFDLNWFFKNPALETVSPYLGLGFRAGILSVSAPGFESDNEIALALGVNFGIDLRVWQSADNRSAVTISSVNDWVFTASNDRTKHLNLGAAVKYYFRP